MYLFTGGNDGSVKQFNIETHQKVYHYKGIHNKTINAIALKSDDKYFFTASYDQSLKQFNIHSSKKLTSTKGSMDLLLIQSP